MIHCRPGQYKTKEDIGVSFIAEAIERVIIILEVSKTRAPAVLQSRTVVERTTD